MNVNKFKIMRRVSPYTNAEKKVLQCESEQLLKEITFNDRKGINVLYKEQEICGAHVADVFANDLSKVNILVCGKTQTGKTGSVESRVYCKEELFIKINNKSTDGGKVKIFINNRHTGWKNKYRSMFMD